MIVVQTLTNANRLLVKMEQHVLKTKEHSPAPARLVLQENSVSKVLPKNVYVTNNIVPCKLGSISSRFASPRSLSHSTAGSLVYPLHFFYQSQPSLLESNRLPCDCSILSLFYPTWRMSVLMSFFLLQSVFQSTFTTANFEKHSRVQFLI